MTFQPEPVDTSKIKLPRSLDDLIDRLAENVHNVWARRRLAEGWRPGPHRNDRTKEHPSLVPFEQLPASEKDYDRETAAETLKMILSLGYRIEEPQREGGGAQQND